MGAYRITYGISLPAEADADAFEEFMRDRYLPAVHRGPTRVGQVTGLTLLRGVADTHEPTHSFVLDMDFEGLATGQLRVDDDAVLRTFDEFGATAERLGAYSTRAVWVEEPGS